jgi:hypothetical protein
MLYKFRCIDCLFDFYRPGKCPKCGGRGVHIENTEPHGITAMDRMAIKELTLYLKDHPGQKLISVSKVKALLSCLDKQTSIIDGLKGA